MNWDVPPKQPLGSAERDPNPDFTLTNLRQNFQGRCWILGVDGSTFDRRHLNNTALSLV